MATTTEQRRVPREVTSPRAKLVYLFVASADSVTPDDVAEALTMDKMTVFSILRTLHDDELLGKSGTEYTCR